MLLARVALALLALTPAAGCATGWTLSEGRCYKYFSDGTITHSNANAACASTFSGATLAVITSAAQNAVAAGLAGSDSENHIGLQYNTGVQAYEWVDGTPVTYQGVWHTVGRCSGTSS